MDYYSAIKRNKIGTFVDMCMDLESIVQSKLEREKQISYINVYMYHSFFINLSVDGHLGDFHALAIVNSAAMNIQVHIFSLVMIFSKCMPRSGIPG